MTLQVEFCGEWIDVPEDVFFGIGREADLAIDENPYLHRRFLELRNRDGMWWLHNVGTGLSATLSDDGARVQSWLAPGAALPIVFSTMTVRFSAGPTSYELCLHLDDPPFSGGIDVTGETGTTTIGAVVLNDEQRLLLLALAEPFLIDPASGSSGLPSSASAAGRLGWSITKFNRKLDNLCQKLKRAGVRGLHGDAASLASNRRARLVEYALAMRLVTPQDLPLLHSGASSEVPYTESED